MSKLLVALIAGAFVLVSASAFADDKTPSNISKEEQAKLKSERAEAKANAAKMTPEEKAAAKKAKRAERQKELSTSEKTQQEGGPGAKTKAQQAAAETKASKEGPKAAKGTLNTPEETKRLQKEKGQ